MSMNLFHIFSARPFAVFFFLIFFSAFLQRNALGDVSPTAPPASHIFLSNGVGITTQPNNLSLLNKSRQKILPKETWPQDLLDATYLTPDTLTIVFEETGIDIKYRLTDQTLTAVAKKYPFITEKQYQELETEKNKDFKNGDTTWVKVAGLLARLELLRQGLTSRYVIRDSLLAELNKTEIPQYILAGLAEKKGAVYLDLSMLKKGFQRQIQETILSYKKDVMAVANFLNMVYFLNEKSFLILKGKGSPPELVDSLAPLEKQYFLSKSKLSRDVRKILTQFAETAEKTWLEEIVGIAEQNGRLYMIKGHTLQQLLMRLPPKLVGTIRKENRKGFTAGSFCALLQKTPTLLENYFRQNPRLLSSLGIEIRAEYNPTLAKAEQIQQRGVSPVVVTAVEELNENTYTSKKAYIQALRLALQEPPHEAPKLPRPTPIPQPLIPVAPCPVPDAPEPSTAKILFDLEKQNTPYKTTPIDFAPGNCGCVNVQKNSTYALYPYWTAQEEEKQKIDFSVISRLAYFYLELDKDNQIINQRHWLDDKEQNQFITQARQHKTKVDLVIYSKQWCNLTEYDSCPSGRESEEVADTITELLTPTLNPIKPYITLGMAPVPTMGDGVIIYLTSLPHDSTCFLSFIKILRQRLQAPVRDTTLGAKITHLFGKIPMRTPKRRLSLMLPDDLLLVDNWSQSLIDFLTEIAGTPKKEKEYFDDLVVLFSSPPLKRQQTLRTNIEQQLDEKYASRMNKKIIPMLIQSDADDPDQKSVNAALNYAKNNFGGIGFIPFPLTAKDAADVVQAGEEKKDLDSPEQQEETKQKETTDEIKPALIPTTCGDITAEQIMGTFPTDCQAQTVDIVGRTMNTYTPWLCKWACPNREWIRITWDSLLIFWAVYLVLSFFYPALEECSKKYKCLFWFLALITAMLIYLSFACDPLYKAYTTDFLVYIMIILTIGIAYSVRKKDYP